MAVRSRLRANAARPGDPPSATLPVGGAPDRLLDAAPIGDEADVAAGEGRCSEARVSQEHLCKNI
eukprot:2030470-Alexandrium_andersonii.AAC.1